MTVENLLMVYFLSGLLYVSLFSGKSGTSKEASDGQDLRDYLMTAVHEVTSAMTTVVKELTTGEYSFYWI